MCRCSFVGDGTNSNGTRDIGGAIEILCSTIEQLPSFGSHRDIGLRCSLVVNDGTMLFVAADGVERDIAEAFLLGTQGCEFLVERDLGLASSLNSRLQPLQKFHHRHAILDHRAAKPLNLRRVFDSLHRCDGRGATHDFALHSLHQRVTGLIGIEQDVILEVVVQTSSNVLIVVDINAAVVQVSLNVGWQLHLINI